MSKGFGTMKSFVARRLAPASNPRLPRQSDARNPDTHALVDPDSSPPTPESTRSA